MDKENKINNQFDKALERLTEEQFWSWVGTWLDVSMVRDTCYNWDSDLKLEEIKNIQSMTKSKENKSGEDKKEILEKLKSNFLEEDRREPFNNREYVEETLRVFDMLIAGFDLDINEHDNAVFDIVSDIFRHFTGEI